MVVRWCGDGTEQEGRSRLGVASLAVYLLASCGGSMAPATGAVPAEAPDTLPAWTLDDSSYAGARLKRVLDINFDPDATLADRERIIASIGGVVIGGVASLGLEGDYYVMLPGNPTNATVDSIVAAFALDPRIRIVSAASRRASKMARVPAEAPDTLPAWTKDDSSYAGRWLKRVLNVQFEPDATLADRQAIIASIGGVVIGGIGLSEPEGDYYVLLPGNPSLATADSIAEVLEADPRVHFASAAFRVGVLMAPIPAEAPDTLPAWTQDDSSYAGAWLKRVLDIQFEPEATLADREAIITSIGGVIIGGVGRSEIEGDYYVLLPGNPSQADADSIAIALEADPRVHFASRASRGPTAMARIPVNAGSW